MASRWRSGSEGCGSRALGGQQEGIMGFSVLGCVDILRLSFITSVISSEARNLKSENGVCTTNLDSSLRCAAFRMTE